MMTTTKSLVRVALTMMAATMLATVGCSTSNDESIDQAELDSTNFELASKAQIEAFGPDALGPDARILSGCSNRQIRSAQAACRNTFCGTRGSNGIHFCDQRPPKVVAQCDCRTGEDPVIECTLTNCPQ